MARKAEYEAQRNKVLLLTNGKESEMNYLDLINKYYKSPYEIINRFVNGSPDILASYAVKVECEYNKIFIIVDVDEYRQNIVAARKIIKPLRNRIQIIISNVSFEVWLINHYMQFNQYKTEKQLEQELNKYLHSIGYKCGYNKNDYELLEEHFIDKIFVASYNAKIAKQKLYRDFIINNNISNPDDLDLISSTSFYKIVEELKLERRKKNKN